MSNKVTQESIAAFRSFVNSPLFESSVSAVLATADQTNTFVPDKSTVPHMRRHDDTAVTKPRKTRTPKVSTPAVGQPVGQRGRIPGTYFVTQTGRNLRGVSDVVKTVYAHLSSKPDGMTMKQLQEDLTMPHSTVWFCINKLKNRHLLRVEVPETVASVAVPETVDMPADAQKVA